MEISIGTAATIILSSVGVIIAVVGIIGTHIRSLRREFKQEFSETRKENNDFRKEIMASNEEFRKEILADNSKIKDYIFKYVSEHKTC
ncbi:MAG: hypothetical protein ACYCSB_01355 [bacterium]|jgi:hypothetical protein